MEDLEDSEVRSLEATKVGHHSFRHLRRIVNKEFAKKFDVEKKF